VSNTALIIVLSHLHRSLVSPEYQRLSDSIALPMLSTMAALSKQLAHCFRGEVGNYLSATDIDPSLRGNDCHANLCAF
jgi:hypothetical protein